MSLHRSISKRDAIALFPLASVLVTACGGSPADQAKPKTLSIRLRTDSPPLVNLPTAFKAKMTTLGYAERKNVVYLDKGVITDPVAIEACIKSLVDAKVDTILAVEVLPALAARKVAAGMESPTVFAPGGDTLVAANRIGGALSERQSENGSGDWHDPGRYSVASGNHRALAAARFKRCFAASRAEV
jgi:hypothetical protein